MLIPVLFSGSAAISNHAVDKDLERFVERF